MMKPRDQQGRNTPDSQPDVVIPVIEESLNIAKKLKDGEKIKVSKTVTVEEEQVRIPLVTERLDIQRKEINRFVDQKTSPYESEEGWVIPVYREVVEKRLMLVEEILIKRLQEEHIEEGVVPLQKERVEIRREGPNSTQ
jgi:stress response protein YsnF